MAPITPKVSVIVPVFNRGEMLVPSIRSLLNQSLKELEIIIVNDGSNDCSGTVIDQLAREHSDIVAVHSGRNVGVHEARLAGLRIARAPWIGFLDADDFSRSNMFATMLGAAEDNDVDIVVCGSLRVNPQRKVIAPKWRISRSQKVSRDIFNRFCSFEFGTGTLWNKLFKRSIIEPCLDLRFPWRQDINEDLLLNIGCFHRANSIFLLRDMLHEYVLVDGSVTSTMENNKAFVETFRAFVLAVTCYEELGVRALDSIIDLYRTQLSWSPYQVADSIDLLPCKRDLEEATRYLFGANPYALVAISARQTQTTVGGVVAIRSLWAALRRKVGMPVGKGA